MTRGWLAAAAVLAVAALGLSWGPVAGAGHPARVAVVLAAVLAVAAVRSGGDRLLLAAVAAGAVGVLLGGPDPTPGRVALAAATGCLLLHRTARRTPAA
ncbi:hypothetical protein [Modestobacter roseus]|uniref:hypothetical protein n=1 Tax=Modestobacter roseus TaxID=1181884 RepID=UPI0012964D19|nr:hypothetical protein [Modestobacter roseus]MQA35431.1 hypothetical protein [Modestobacter roseus]